MFFPLLIFIPSKIETLRIRHINTLLPQHKNISGKQKKKYFKMSSLQCVQTLLLCEKPVLE